MDLLAYYLRAHLRIGSASATVSGGGTFAPAAT